MTETNWMRFERPSDRAQAEELPDASALRKEQIRKSLLRFMRPATANLVAHEIYKTVVKPLEDQAALGQRAIETLKKM